MRRLSKVSISWSPALAYAVGLIATDGNLSKDGRHINFTSKDIDSILTFKNCLALENSIGRKARGREEEKRYFQVQFGDVNFYEFLIRLGLTPAKSKTIKSLKIPDNYFADFLRGCVDGDGCIGFYSHPESKHPQLRIRLYSASCAFLEWIKNKIGVTLGISGGWIEKKDGGLVVLTYAKQDSLKLISFLYYDGVEYYLKRKYDIVVKFFGRVAELV